MDAIHISNTGGLIAPKVPPERPAGANGLSAAPGSPPRASKAASFRFFKLPSISTSRLWTLLFGRPNTETRAQSYQRGEGQAGVGAPAGDAKTPNATQAAALTSSRGAQPQTFGALYGDNGSLSRDVVTALMQRLEERIPGLSNKPGDAQDGAMKPDAADRPVDGTMTDPELRGLTEKLMRAEAMLGKQDSVELRAVKALRDQVFGARANLLKPEAVVAATEKAAKYSREGSASIFSIGGDRALPGVPASTHISPMFGGTYTSTVNVSDDRSVSETRSVEARLGLVGHINAFFAKLDVGVTGRINRTRGHGYADHEHLVHAAGSKANKAGVELAALDDLQQAVSPSVLTKSFSLATLGKLSEHAYGKYDEFAKTAAMLGVIVQQPRADSMRHPLEDSYKSKVGSGARFQVDTAGVKLHTSATVGLAVAGLTIGAVGSASVAGSKASTGVRAYVPVWKSLNSEAGKRVGKDITQKRLDNLRKALSPMVQSLQKYHGQSAQAGTAFPQVLDAVVKWQPGQPPVDASALTHTLNALTTELDLYCHAKRVESSDPRADTVCRSIEQAWGIKPKEGAYGYLRALAATAALIDLHAGDTQTQPLDGFQDLTSRLTSPAMPHDGARLQRATGFKDIQRTHTYEAKLALGAGAGVTLAAVNVGAEAGAEVKVSRVDHFNITKAGDFVDVDISVGMGAALSLDALTGPLTDWIGEHLSKAIGSLADSGLAGAIAKALGAGAGDLVESIDPAIGAKVNLIISLRLSKPLAAPQTAGGAAPSVDGKAGSEPKFNVEHVRLSVKGEFSLDTEVRPVRTVRGKNAVRSVMSSLDAIYAKPGGRAVREPEAQNYLNSDSMQRDLPAILQSLGNDDSAATHQVRAFVRVALEEVDGEAAQALQNCESDFFDAMRAYAAVAASQSGNPVAEAGAGQEGPSAVSAGSSMPSDDAALNAGLHASPEYAAAQKALLGLTDALRGPSAARRDRATEYAATLGKLPANA